MAINNEMLIAEVEKRPALWQVKSKVYKDNKKKDVLWTEIALLLLPGVDEGVRQLRTRWKSLKDRLRRLLNDLAKSQTSGAGAEDVADPVAWPYFEQMSFVRDSLEHRRTSGNIPSSMDFLGPVPTSSADAAAGEESVTYVLHEADDFEFHPEGGSPPTNLASTSEATNEPQKKKKKGTPDPLMAELQSLNNTIANRKTPDPHENFALSLCDEMRSVHPSKIVRMRVDIMNVIAEYQEN